MDFVKFCLINKSPLFFRRNYVSFGALSRFKCTACSNCLKSRSVLQIIQCLKGAVHHQRLIQSGFSHVSVTYSEPIDIVWRQHLSFYPSHYLIRDMNPLIGAITLNGNIYFHWNYVTRGFKQNLDTSKLIQPFFKYPENQKNYLLLSSHVWIILKLFSSVHQEPEHDQIWMELLTINLNMTRLGWNC